MDKSQVDALERRIKEEYEKKLTAIRIVQELLSQNGNNPVPVNALSVRETAPSDKEDDAGEQSLVGNIENIFLAEPRRTWTVPKIEKRLLELSIPLMAKNPRPSIAGAIKRLMKREVVRLVKKGGGKIPHTYMAGERASKEEK